MSGNFVKSYIFLYEKYEKFMQLIKNLRLDKYWWTIKKRNQTEIKFLECLSNIYHKLFVALGIYSNNLAAR
jgi:hypothetical protein